MHATCDSIVPTAPCTVQHEITHVIHVLEYSSYSYQPLLSFADVKQQPNQRKRRAKGAPRAKAKVAKTDTAVVEVLQVDKDAAQTHSKRAEGLVPASTGPAPRLRGRPTRAEEPGDPPEIEQSATQPVVKRLVTPEEPKKKAGPGDLHVLSFLMDLPHRSIQLIRGNSGFSTSS
jgi:hypothetical protein